MVLLYRKRKNDLKKTNKEWGNFSERNIDYFS